MLADCNSFIEIYQTARERLADQPAQSCLLLNPQMHLVLETGADRRRENLPTANELVVILPDEYAEASNRDIVFAVHHPAQHGAGLTWINVTHAAYIPLHYVLLFPHGEYGWHYELRLRQDHRDRVRTRLEQRPFYRYRLHVYNSEYPTLFRSGRLFQQYIIDAFVACETTALE
jgi:hypothetical protein